jgi:hypothetical protein
MIIFVKKIMKSIQYTSTIPSELMQQIDQLSVKFKIPKNRIIEEALKAYFDRMKQAEYIYSFKKASTDEEVGAMAEEGFEDYLKILEKP